MTRSFFSSSAVALLACLATTPAAAQQRGDLLQQNPSGVSPQAAAVGYDGSYAGSMAHSVGHLGAHSNPSQKYLKFPSQPIWASWSVG